MEEPEDRLKEVRSALYYVVYTLTPTELKIMAKEILKLADKKELEYNTTN